MASHSIEEHIVRELIKDNSETFKGYLAKLSRDEIIALFDDFLDRKEKTELKIPLDILKNRKLSCFEAVVKFLRDDIGLSNQSVSKILNRSQQTCWTTYRNASRKYPDRLQYEFSDEDIPISVIGRGALSILESIVVWLAKKELTFHEIAKALNRDDRTIWTVHRRAMTKDGH